ncbi:MAG TPA: VOC family protein [Candidatus Eisenbacteria bacterium]|nr:VOC family protein [Candidatus Eisenbacteria bacterium]
MAKPNPIPKGYTTVTASLIFRDAPKAIEFYKKAFGASERARALGPDGKIMHAEIQIGSAIVMLSDEVMGQRSAETIGSSPVSFYLYFEDADAAYQKAIAAGGKSMMPVTEMFWGDRMGHIADPFGYTWNVASHVKDVTPEEMKKGQEEFMKQMAGAR